MQYTQKSFTAMVLSSLVVAGVANAAPKKSSGSSMSSSKASNRDYLVSLPLVADRPQLMLHLEYNLMQEAGIAIEGAILGETESLPKDEIDETGNSMKVKGSQVSLVVARYSEPARLSGFFWALGAGYRQYSTEWKKKIDKEEVGLRLDSVDEQGYLHHRVNVAGTTGHARVGYRWTAAEWPVSIAGHVGLRHMNSRVKDVEVDDSEEQELKVQYSDTNDSEKKSLKNTTMTEPDIRLDFGLSF